MQRILFLIFFVFMKVAIMGQTTCRLSGMVADENNSPVHYADIILLAAEDSAILYGTSTDETGRFRFDGIKNGHYLLKTHYTGYEQKIIRKIFINDNHVELNKIILRKSLTTLGEVSVFSKKKEGLGGGAMVYEIDKKNFISGETARDVLQLIPSIGFDMDDRITLRGSEPTLLIDGAESDLSDMLDQIPVSAIESIEVMAVPSVKFETKNGAGIVNIRLKKNRDEGHSLNLKAGSGLREMKDLNATLGYNRTHWKYAAMASYKHIKNETEEDNLRTVGTGNSKKYLQQHQEIFLIPSSFFLNTKVTYLFPTESFIDFHYTLQGKKQEQNISNYSQNLNNVMSLSAINKILRNETDENLFNEFGSDFHKQYKDKKRLLDARFFYSFNVPGNQFSNLVQPLNITTLLPQKAYNSEDRHYENHINLFKLNLDYCMPLSKRVKIDMGGVVSIRGYDQELFATKTILKWDKTVKDYVSATTRSDSHFNYKGRNYSIYALVSGTKNKYSFSGGLRYEYTFTEAKTENRDPVILHKLLPSLYLKKRAGKNYSWEISFTSRSKPPGYNQLNPISRSFSTYNRTSGNPDLLPEYFHQVEWVHRLEKDKRYLSIAFYHKNWSNLIGRYYYLETEDGKTISHSRYENMGDNRSTGIDVSSDFMIGKWSFIPGINSFYCQISTKRGQGMFDREKIISSLKLNSNYNLSKAISIQAAVRYFSPLISIYGHQSGYFIIDSGLKARVFNRKGVVGMKVLDVMNTHEYDKVVDQRVDQFIEGHVDPKSFMVSVDFSYLFGTAR